MLNQYIDWLRVVKLIKEKDFNGATDLIRIVLVHKRKQNAIIARLIFVHMLLLENSEMHN